MDTDPQPSTAPVSPLNYIGPPAEFINPRQRSLANLRPWQPGESGNPLGRMPDGQVNLPPDSLFGQRFAAELNRQLSSPRNMRRFVTAVLKRAIAHSDRMAIEIIARLDGPMLSNQSVNNNQLVVLPNWMQPNAQTQPPSKPPGASE